MTSSPILDSIPLERLLVFYIWLWLFILIMFCILFWTVVACIACNSFNGMWFIKKKKFFYPFAPTRSQKLHRNTENSWVITYSTDTMNSYPFFFSISKFLCIWFGKKQLQGLERLKLSFTPFSAHSQERKCTAWIEERIEIPKDYLKINYTSH